MVDFSIPTIRVRGAGARRFGEVVACLRGCCQDGEATTNPRKANRLASLTLRVGMRWTLTRGVSEATDSLLDIQHRHVRGDLADFAGQVATNFADGSHVQDAIGNLAGTRSGQVAGDLFEGRDEGRTHAQASEAHAEERQEAAAPRSHFAAEW